MIPERTSLISETIKVLRLQIEQGQFRDFLPSERHLSQQFQIGRNTLRSALQSLQDDGWLEASHSGRPRRILRGTPNGTEEEKGDLKHVYVLSNLDLDKMTSSSLMLVDELRRSLTEADCRMEVLHVEFTSQARLDQRLRNLVESRAPGVWVLMSCPPYIQSWFADNKLYAIAVGYAEKSQLPYVAVDLNAVTRHLAGRLANLGHTSAAVFQSGDELRAHRVINDGLQSTRHHLLQTRVAHDGHVADICKKVESLLRIQEDRPTVFVLLTVQELCTVMSYLMHRGVRIPEDISLVMLVDDTVLATLVPTVSRYGAPIKRVVNRLYNNLFKVWTGGPGSVKPCRIMSEFIGGETLGPRP